MLGNVCQSHTLLYNIVSLKWRFPISKFAESFISSRCIQFQTLLDVLKRIQMYQSIDTIAIEDKVLTCSTLILEGKYVATPATLF